MKEARLTDNQIKTAGADLARKVSKNELLAQINYYNQPSIINNHGQLDDLYVHMYALGFKD